MSVIRSDLNGYMKRNNPDRLPLIVFVVTAAIVLVIGWYNKMGVFA